MAVVVLMGMREGLVVMRMGLEVGLPTIPPFGQLTSFLRKVKQIARVLKEKKISLTQNESFQCLV
jgi:hypothetical protein